jgi:hypothetical protein
VPLPPETPIDAVEWKEPAPDGGSQAQIFRLADGRIALVKFAENHQGPRVLFNEFVSCRLAQRFRLPINQSVLVKVDAAVLTIPQRDGRCPTSFRAGVHCGLIRYPDAAKTGPATPLFKRTQNAMELHSVLVFEQLVARGDGRQLLVYPANDPDPLFAAYDYGFAFGGQPVWTEASVRSLQPPPTLPSVDALGLAYGDGEPQRLIIDSLRRLTRDDIEAVISALDLPRWGVNISEGEAIADAIPQRAAALAEAYDAKYPKQPDAESASGTDEARGVE